ncbi:MAG TPA: hypothetical protein PLB14_07145 [Smithellaceae bacterium]|nr:hypothetical protein [Smithellaceae bacterium]
MKFFAENNKCWDCGEALTATPKQYFLGTALPGGAAVSLTCPGHNRGYVAALAPETGREVPVEVEIDLAGSRRKTEEAIRDTLRLLSEADSIRLLAAINVAVETARNAGLKWTDAGFVRR